MSVPTNAVKVNGLNGLQNLVEATANGGQGVPTPDGFAPVPAPVIQEGQVFAQQQQVPQPVPQPTPQPQNQQQNLRTDQNANQRPMFEGATIVFGGESGNPFKPAEATAPEPAPAEGKQADTPDTQTGAEEAPAITPSPVDLGWQESYEDPALQAIVHTFANKGITEEQAVQTMEEFLRTGDASKIDMESLSKMIGAEQAGLVSSAAQGLMAKEAAYRAGLEQTFIECVGGKEQYDRIRSWIDANKIDPQFKAQLDTWSSHIVDDSTASMVASAIMNEYSNDITATRKPFLMTGSAMRQEADKPMDDKSFGLKMAQLIADDKVDDANALVATYRAQQQ